MVNVQTLGKNNAGETLKKVTISNNKQESVDFLNYGGIITSINVLNADAVLGDVCLGYDNALDYSNNPNYFGAVVGRCAGRIKGASFEICGKKYNVTQNEGNNHLHGGFCGFNKKIYDLKKVGDNSVELSAVSEDKEEGYPNRVDFKVRYSFDDRSRLTIEYEATSTGDTVLNLTNHSYFNLDDDKKDILSHKMWIDADYIVKLGRDLAPADGAVNINNTALDFKTGKEIGKDIDAKDELISIAGGYDFCYILNQHSFKEPVAQAYSKTSGRVLNVYTDNPCIVFYSSNMLNDDRGKGGVKYTKHMGFCLECQGFAPNFKGCGNSQVLHKGEVYKRKTVYEFGVVK